MKSFSFLDKKVMVLLLSLLFIGQALFLPIQAAEPSASLPLPNVSGASSVYLYHFESEQVLMKRSGLKQIAPASTVKMMTGLVALDKLRDRLNETVTVTEEMIRDVEGFRIHLEPQMDVSVRDLLYGVICAGGNDAAQALAMVCSGSVDQFVQDMNQKAKEIGCNNTCYTNPTGMDDAKMMTTLDDVILLANQVCEDELFLNIAATAQYIVATPTKNLTLYNRNAQISSFSAPGYQNRYAKGLNAGMTDRGGHCVISLAEHQDNSYLCIVMGAVENDSGIQSYRISNTLLNYVIESYSYRLIAQKGDSVCRMSVALATPVDHGEECQVTCVLDRDLYGFIPKNVDATALEFKTYFHQDPLTAPLKKGCVVGGVDIYYEDHLLASGRLLAESDQEANKILRVLDSTKQLLRSRLFLIIVLVAAALFLVYFLFFERHRIDRISAKKKSRR